MGHEGHEERSDIDIFTPVQIGRYKLRNRILMAPLTRQRSEKDLSPNKKWAKTYYEQRASAGLIITEATLFSADGAGYPATPGIYTREHVEGWKPITEAVHAKGAIFFCQLWHCGRQAHSSFMPDGNAPWAPSPTPRKEGQVLTYDGPKDWETPRELPIEEIKRIQRDFRKGVENSLEAGFDGIEIHGANGYLIDQFLRDGTNKRNDEYGGSIENRARFLLELVQIAVDVAGSDRVGVRLSPGGSYLENLDSDHKNHKTLFTTVVQLLEPFNLAYLHLKESDAQDERHGGTILPPSVFRPLFSNPIIGKTDYDKTKANRRIRAGDVDAVAFGRLFIANPDLPRRFEVKGARFNQPDFGTFYGGTDVGYIDYPFLDDDIKE